LKELYPIYLDLTDRLCVVVGSGDAALDRARVIDEAGAKLRMVASDFSDEVLKEFGEFHELRRKQYDTSDIEDAFLVVAATDNNVLNSLIAADCRERGTLVSTVGQPVDCDYFVPGVVRRGGIHIAVSAGGHSPELAEWVKREVERGISHRLEEGLDIIAAAKQEIIASDPEEQERCAEGFRKFFESDIWRDFLNDDRGLTVEQVVEWISSLGD
jgi:precorrin-2 dehydrogenase/sirohydrochlorin ferrochelatase